MKSSITRAAAACAALLLAGTLPAAAQEAPAPPEAGKKPPAEVPRIPPAMKPAATHHQTTLSGRLISYTATAATTDIKNDKDDVIGRMFYVAYTMDGVKDEKNRPVTFFYNGGPGSSTIWLHMGSVGPVRVVTTDAMATPPPPYQVVENKDSLLDATD